MEALQCAEHMVAVRELVQLLVVVRVSEVACSLGELCIHTKKATKSQSLLMVVTKKECHIADSKVKQGQLQGSRDVLMSWQLRTETWQKPLWPVLNTCVLWSEVNNMGEKTYIDYATVRDALENAQERRGELSYEQNMALNHAIWAAGDSRNGIVTETKVFNSMLKDLLEVDKLAAAPDIAAKIAEIIPVNPDDVKAILASRRVVMDDDEVEHIVTLVRQHVGYEG